MRKIYRIVSVGILTCFLFNTTAYELSIDTSNNYQPNTYKLAPSSKLDDLEGIEHKDMGRIEVALQAKLKGLVGDDKSLPRTVDEFRRALFAWEAQETTQIGPARMEFENMQSFLYEIGAIEEALFYVKCRISDEKAPKKTRTYYAVFSPVIDKDGGFHIETYTEKEWQEEGIEGFIRTTKTVPLRKLQKPKDAEAKDAYVRHEEIEDPFWASKMTDENEHIICSDNMIRALLFDEFTDVRKEFEKIGITEKNSKLLLILNALIWTGHKDLIFVHANEDELPPTRMKDSYGNWHTIPESSHSSNKNIFIALDDEAWKELKQLKYNLEQVGLHMMTLRGDRDAVKDYRKDIEAATALKNRLGRIFHEIGAFCGREGWVEERNGKLITYNEVDKLRELVVQPETAERNAEIAHLQEIVKQMKPINLDTHLVGRDYAAGETSKDEPTADEIINFIKDVLTGHKTIAQLNSLLKEATNKEVLMDVKDRASKMFPDAQRYQKANFGDLLNIVGVKLAIRSRIDELEKQGEQLAQKINEVWEAAGENINNPASQEAQKAFAEITALANMYKIEGSSITRYRILHAYLYGEGNYDVVLNFFEMVKEERPDVFNEIITKRDFMILYLVARIMHNESIQGLLQQEKPAYVYFIEQLVGQDIDAFDFIGKTTAEISSLLSAIGNAIQTLSQLYSAREEYDKALKLLDNYIETQRHDHRISGDTGVLMVIKVWENIRERIVHERAEHQNLAQERTPSLYLSILRAIAHNAKWLLTRDLARIGLVTVGDNLEEQTTNLSLATRYYGDMKRKALAHIGLLLAGQERETEELKNLADELKEHSEDMDNLTAEAFIRACLLLFVEDAKIDKREQYKGLDTLLGKAIASNNLLVEAICRATALIIGQKQEIQPLEKLIKKAESQKNHMAEVIIRAALLYAGHNVEEQVEFLRAFVPIAELETSGYSLDREELNEAAISLACLTLLRYEMRKEKEDRRQKPGRSPEDALTLIALSELDGFTIREFHQVYNKLRRRFGYAKLPKERPDSQTRRDLNKLIEEGYLVAGDVARPYRYHLTEEGRIVADLLRKAYEGEKPQNVNKSIQAKFGELDLKKKIELLCAIGYMKELLPEKEDLSVSKVLDSIVRTNLTSPERYDYQRHKEKITLPPTFIFDGKVFASYEGKQKPRYIVLTSSPDGVSITTVVSRVKNEKYIFAKGGCRWYEVGKVGVESWEEKVAGNREKNLDPLLPEGVRLAEAMFYKSPFADVYFDGGKTIFLARKDSDKERIVRDWVASSILAESLLNIYLAGPDTYMGYQEMEWIEEEKVVARRQFGMGDSRLLATTSRDPDPEKAYGTFPHEEWMATSISVVETMLTALANEKFVGAFKIDTENMTMAIPGFGDVGGGVIRYLAKFYPDIFNKIRITLVADSKGAIYNKDGLDKDELLALIERRAQMLKEGKVFALKDEYLKEDPERESKFTVLAKDRDAYYMGATILIPSARGTFVFTEDDLEKMYQEGTRLISEGANNFAAIRIENLFEKHKIAYFYGAAANFGGIYFSKEEVFHALLEGTKSMEEHKDERRIHLQGDVADTACGNAWFLVNEFLAGHGNSIYDIHQQFTNEIIDERARLLDNPTREERDEILERVALDFARGVEVNEENEGVLTIVNASELAREKVMARAISEEDVLRDIDSTDLWKKRAAMYWAGKLRIQRTIPQLVSALGDPYQHLHPHIRRLAAVALAYINDKSVIPTLRVFYRNPEVDKIVKVGIEWALVMLTQSQAVEEIISRVVEDIESAEPRTEFSIFTYAKETDEKFIQIVEFLFRQFLVRTEDNRYIKTGRKPEDELAAEIEEMQAIADEVGKEIVPPVERSILFVSYNFYKHDEEYDSSGGDKMKYRDRFNLVRIMRDRTDKIIPWVIDQVRQNGLDPHNVVVQLPAQFKNEKYKTQLGELTEMGIKFMIINTKGMNNIKSSEERTKRRLEIYLMMALARVIDESTPKNSKLYRLLEFFISAHFDMAESDVTIEEYMEALMENNPALLIKAALSYKPIVPKDLREEYDRVSEALIRA